MSDAISFTTFIKGEEGENYVHVLFSQKPITKENKNIVYQAIR